VAANNPSTVLIVFLVFFIVLSIGLGVWGYLGQKKAGELDKKAAEAKKTSDKDQHLADYYKLQALWARSAAGYDLTKDEANHLSTLLSDQKKFSSDTNYAGVDKMIGTDKKELVWDDKAKGLTRSYRKELERLKRENTQLVDDKKRLDEKLAAADAREQARDRKNNEFEAKLEEKTNEVNEQAKDAMRRANARVEAAGKAKREAEEGRANDVRKLTEEKEDLVKKYEKTGKEKDEKVAALQKKLKQVQAKQSEEKAAKIDLLAFESARGKIVRVDRTGQMPFTNLGTADRAKEQLTFSIFGVDASGKPGKEPKGTLEIIKVIGPHLSRARVTSLKDAGGSPVQEGDKLFNPAWDPDHQIHVAIAGFADFNPDELTTKAEQERNLKEFMNYLEGQNVVVDAYVDPSDGKIKVNDKGITLNTDYLILGSIATYGGRQALDLKDEKVDYNQKVSASAATLRKEANDKGVTVIPLRKFATLTGYHIPKAGRSVPASYRNRAPQGEKKRTLQPKKKKGEAAEDEGKKDEADKKDADQDVKDKKDEDKKDDKKKDDDAKDDKKDKDKGEKE
jgi:hypothetical protein